MQHDEVFKHLQQLRNTPTAELRRSMEPAQDAELWKAYQQGDKSVTTKILVDLKPTIDKAITAYAGGNKEYSTKAKILALEAVTSYDPTKGTQLTTHVFNSLKKLQRLAADRGNIIHIPEQTALDKKHVDKVIRDYTIDNGEEPSRQQLSDITGMSISKLDRILNVKGSTSTSMTRSDQGDSLESAPRTAVGLYEDTLYQELDPTNQKIYDWLTGYKGSPILSRQEVAHRLKITPAALSQRIGKIDNFFAANGARIEEVIYGRHQ